MDVAAVNDAVAVSIPTDQFTLAACKTLPSTETKEMTERNRKARESSHAVEIPGIHPSLILSTFLVSPAVLLFMQWPEGQTRLPQSHMVWLLIAGILGLVSAVTSSGQMILKRKSDKAPLIIIKTYKILWIPVWRSRRVLEKITAATAAKSLDWVGFFFFCIFSIVLSILLSWVVMAIILLYVFLFWAIAAIGNVAEIVVRIKMRLLGELLLGGHIPGPMRIINSLLAMFNPGQLGYTVRVIVGSKRLPICSRLNSPQTSRVLNVLRSKFGVELSRLPPEFA